jgi:tRNA dimethylallyltransferase
MQKENPEDFNRWEKHQRKLIRAYEVFQLTGQSITQLQTTWEHKLQFPIISWTLQWERDVLRSRIEERTHIMLKSGWIEEAIQMREQGILKTPTAHQVLGYKQIYSYLNKELSYDEMEQKIITATWRLARRQMTWFRGKHPETTMIKMPQRDEILIEKLSMELNNG